MPEMRNKKRIKPFAAGVLSLLIAASLVSPGIYVRNARAEGEKGISTWTDMVTAINGAGTTETVIKLAADISPEQDQGAMIIPKGKNITVDMAGFSINRGIKGSEAIDDGYVIRIEDTAVLTLKDSTGKGGLITGGANTGNGGAILCEDGSSLTLAGVSIKDNYAKNGGGIYLSKDCELYLGDCDISDNHITGNGGGIYGGSSHITFLGGLTKIKNNIKDTGSDNDVFMTKEMENLRFWTWSSKNVNTRKAKYSGAFKKGTRIGISLEEMRKEISDGYAKVNPSGASRFFYYNGTEYEVSDNVKLSEVTVIKNLEETQNSSQTLLEVYKSGKLTDKKNFTSFTKAIEAALASDGESVVTMGGDHSSDEEIIISENKNVTIDLNGHYIKRERNLETKKNGGVIIVRSGATLTITDSNPKRTGYDGVKGGVITGGASSNAGGGITLEGNAHLIMMGGTIYDCISDESGGGVYLDTGSEDTSFTMTGGRIYNCRAIDSTDECYGGGIYLGNGKLDLKDADIDNCYSEDDGGAIFCQRGEVRLDNMTFSGNRSINRGGAIYVSLDVKKYDGTTFYASSCTFTGNSSEEDGGAFFLRDNPQHGASVMFDNCVFKNNTAKEDGGAITAFDDSLVLSNVTITGNQAGGYGGGVFVDSRYDINLKGVVVIKDNTCSEDASCGDLVLEDGKSTTAKLTSGGLVKGSWIGIGTTSEKSVMLAENISVHEMKYFHAGTGKIDAREVKKIEAPMEVTSSIFGNGNFVKMLMIGSIGLVMLIVFIVVRRKVDADTDGNGGGL
ncbi:MAG: hypothetical protein IJM01_08470 [Eubacterium sp.]|nr:hypothetical protein [Eubacterium sp.]